MVHYDPAAAPPVKPPTLCPKCGSHRTEIVDKSVDASIVVVRCNACGARSEIANPSYAQAAPVTDEDLASFMKQFIVGGDFRRRVRGGSALA
jgi:hypothetical protein